MMKLAIVGTRNPSVPYDEWKKLFSIENVTEIVSGGAKGIDTYAEQLALESNIKLKVFKPDYKKFGRNATILRNNEIAEYCDRVIAFPSTESRGTYDTIKKARMMNKSVKVIFIH
ncbi:MAG: DNA-processing protein DprA [Prevotella sp.]|nr:DNA-processing protein DprA [Prevotella sp.]